ncbi:hypothetical protein D3C76_1157540 [compost metagenome]
MLFDGFHPFADHFQVQGMGHGDDRLDDLAVFEAARHILQERAVDLQHIQWQALEVGKRRIAGAEVVDRQADALVTNALEQADGALDVAHQGVFGDLQLQVMGRKTSMRQCHFHFVGQRLVAKGHCRAIDRDLEGAVAVTLELGQVLAGAAQHPQVQVDDQAVGFGDADETVRPEQTMLWMLPAHQRLELGDLATVQVEDGLVMHA